MRASHLGIRGRQLRTLMWLAILLPPCGCGEENCPSTEPLPAQFDAQTDLTAEIALWRYDRAAALSLAFDDTRQCYYEIVAPTLESRGFRGTFNLDTDRASRNWTPWVDLFQRGHELGNHTRHHCRLPDVTLDAARAEIEGGREDLLAGVPGLNDVVTFTYPNAASTPEVRQIVMESHLSARGTGGINAASPEDYSLLAGSSYGDLPSWRIRVARCISEGGWMIHYFHEVGGDGVPVDDFVAYVDHLAAREDSVWVAPQGEVAKYAIERDNCSVVISGGTDATMCLQSSLDPSRFALPLTILVHVLSDTIGFLIVEGEVCPVEDGHPIVIEILPGDCVSVSVGSVSDLQADPS